MLVTACGGSRDLSRENAELERCGLPVPTSAAGVAGLSSSRSTDFLVVHFDASSTAQSAWDVQMEYARREMEEGRRPMTVADASVRASRPECQPRLQGVASRVACGGAVCLPRVGHGRLRAGRRGNLQVVIPSRPHERG